MAFRVRGQGVGYRVWRLGLTQQVREGDRVMNMDRDRGRDAVTDARQRQAGERPGKAEAERGWEREGEGTHMLAPLR